MSWFNVKHALSLSNVLLGCYFHDTIKQMFTNECKISKMSINCDFVLAYIFFTNIFFSFLWSHDHVSFNRKVYVIICELKVLGYKAILFLYSTFQIPVCFIKITFSVKFLFQCDFPCFVRFTIFWWFFHAWCWWL